MGLRFRKSIKLGGGFRLNLSKSGVGYSWGKKDSAYQNQQKVAQEKLSQSPAQVFHILLRRENQSGVNQQQQSRIIHKAIQILQSRFRLILKFSVLKRLRLQQ